MTWIPVHLSPAQVHTAQEAGIHRRRSRAQVSWLSLAPPARPEDAGKGRSGVLGAGGFLAALDKWKAALLLVCTLWG